MTAATEPTESVAHPLLTIAMPAHDEALSLPRSLAALLSNVEALSSPGDVEIVLLDDGSEDSTAALAASLLGARARIVSQPNRGRVASRRALIDLASGRFILMLDAHVELDPGTIGWWFNKTDRPEVVNGDVRVELNSPYAHLWDTLTTFGWREYLTNRRPISFGIEDFDRFPKGTGMFLAPREVWLEAYEDSGLDDSPAGAIVSDDTRLLRALAAKHRIWLHPGFAGTYFSPRTSLSQFVSNARYRGQTFVDSYWESPSLVGRATRLLPVAATVGMSVIGLTAWRSQRAASALVAIACAMPSAGVALMAIVGGKAPRQAALSAAVAPAFTVSFGAGLVRGLAAKMGPSRGRPRDVD